MALLSRRGDLFPAFHPARTQRMGTGDRRRLADFEPGFRPLRLLPDDVAGNGLFSSLIFFVIEQKVNPEVKDYSDALWWASWT